MLASVVAAIVLSILGMHALNTHGVTTATTSSAGTETSGMPGMSVGSHERAAGTHNRPAQVGPGPVTTAPSGKDGHNMGSMVMLCVAMLAAAAGLSGLIALALALRRTPRGWACRPAAPTTPRRFAFSRLAAGPPTAWELSIIRC